MENTVLNIDKFVNSGFLDLKKIDTTLIGMRLPKDYFVSTGVGESDLTVHAGSYHLALKDAGIEMCNIMTYSSIMPACANEIDVPKTLTHGSVLETIMAVSTARKGKRATVGVIWGTLYNKETSQKHGGLVCEYNGNLSELKARNQLNLSLDELYTNGYSDLFELKDIRFVGRSIIPRKKFGTVIVSINFVNYLIPLIKEVS